MKHFDFNDFPLFYFFSDKSVTNMCPPKSDETKLDTIHSGAEIEVKPAENCLTHGLQVIKYQSFH